MRQPEKRMRGESAAEQREVITIQASTPTENSKGEPLLSWSNYKTIRAYVESTGSTEWWGQQQVMTTTFYEAVTRFDPDITQTMRAIWRGKTMNITGIKPRGDKNRLWWLHILMYEAQ